MREIKFRAWRESDKQMITENNMHSPRALYFNGKTFYTYEKMSTFGGGDGIRYEDNLILMQYTGLKDKNSVEIYEGDIIRVLGDKCTVFWQQGAFKFQKNTSNYNIQPLFDFATINKCVAYEVIGNIYQNKELLK